jgi:hypothetical protein
MVEQEDQLEGHCRDACRQPGWPGAEWNGGEKHQESGCIYLNFISIY